MKLIGMIMFTIGALVIIDKLFKNSNDSFDSLSIKLFIGYVLVLFGSFLALM